MGGAWKRQIRSVRRILRILMAHQNLTDEGLRTLLVEIEAILNSRPLTPVTMDPEANVIYCCSEKCETFLICFQVMIIIQRSLGAKFNI